MVIICFLKFSSDQEKTNDEREWSYERERGGKSSIWRRKSDGGKGETRPRADMEVLYGHPYA